MTLTLTGDILPSSINFLATILVTIGPNTDWIVNISTPSSSGNVPETPNLLYAV